MTDLVVRDQLVPTQIQRKFYAACDEEGAEEILFSGSIRGGKTQAAVARAIAAAWTFGGPGWKLGVFRRTYRELEDSTKGVFLRGDGGLPPSLPPELYHPKDYRVADNMITLKNGAEILFRSLENPKEAAEKIRNVTFGAMFVDQVEELDGDGYEELYDTMLSRLSDPRGPGQMYLVANPGRTEHWVYKRFHPDSPQKLPETRYVHVTLHDNREHLDPKYYDRQIRQKTRNPEWYDRFIEGKWGAFGGKRFKKFKAEFPWVIDPVPIDKGWEITEGIDYGWRAPTVWLAFAVDYYGLWYGVAEHYASELAVSQHAAAIKAKREEYGIAPSATFIDPSTWAQGREYQSVALEFMEYGIDVARAQNERIGGWNRLEELLNEFVPDPYQEGIPFEDRRLVPRLRFFAGRCPNLLRELPNLTIKEGTDDVEKTNDHASDAARYVVMSHPPVPFHDASTEADVDRRQQYAQRTLEKAQDADSSRSLMFG